MIKIERKALFVLSLALLGGTVCTKAENKVTLTNEYELSFIKSGKKALRSKKKLPVIKETVYKSADIRGLKVEMLPGMTSEKGAVKAPPINAYLRVNKKGGLHHLNRSYRIGDVPKIGGGMPLVKELQGLPGIVTNLEKYSPYTIKFKLSKPARVYAYIDWTQTEHDNKEMSLWTPFLKAPLASASVYYRDFPAGVNVMNFNADPFIGIGISPLDALSSQEKIIAYGLTANDKLELNVRNEYKSDQKLLISYTIKDPSIKAPVYTGKLAATVKPGDNKVVIPTNNTKEGVVYFVDTTIKAAECQLKRTSLYGRFPVPAADASVTAPIFPYGAYIKLTCNDDPAIYDLMFSATCYHFRKMGMNTAVFASKGAPARKLDIIQKYKLKAVVRLGSMHGRVNYIKPGSIKHPAILTYMVGDEPVIGPKLDAHIKMFQELTKKYPQFKPISCTIYDGYGTGANADPDRIYNDYLDKFKLIRFGRLYCFQKLEYGIGNPIAYKPRQEVTSIMLGLEADTTREWWVAPQFFGVPEERKVKPLAYWRIPTGHELSAFMHLAVAHRCTGLLGWGTHSHNKYTGVCFDGNTMAITRPEAYKELAEFGKQLMKIKPILQNYTTSLVAVHRVEPFAVDVQARWLKSGQMIAYATNRDFKNSANAELLIFLGHEKIKRFGNPKQFLSEVDSVVDVLTGKKVKWTSKWIDGCGYLKITDRIAPGRSALYMVYGKKKGGKFSGKAVPKGAKSHLVDKAFLQYDF